MSDPKHPLHPSPSTKVGWLWVVFYLLCSSLLWTACDQIALDSPCEVLTCPLHATCDANAGKCRCDDGYISQDNACVPEPKGACTTDADCDDGLSCNGDEHCDTQSGTCVLGTAVVCDENARCAEPDGACLCAPPFVATAEGCSAKPCTTDADCADDEDADACTPPSTCDTTSNTCQYTSPDRCNDPYQQCHVVSDGFRCVEQAPAGTTACALIETTDWGTVGTLAVLNLETGEVKDNITTYAQDAVLRVVHDEVYVLERHLYDAVLKLDAYKNYRTDWNFSVAYDEAPIPNPHDMVAWGDYFYLAMYNEGRILRVNAHPDPLDIDSFLGASIVDNRIETEPWDDPFAELTALRVDGDILFALTQGLNESWTCGSPENKGRIYAFHLPDMEDANIFEGGKNYVTLAHCNTGGWVDMHDGRWLIYALADYRSITSSNDDGGLQIFDFVNRKLGPVVATEATVGDRDLFNVIRAGERYFALVVGNDVGALQLIELFPTADDSPWTAATETLYENTIWSLFSFQDSIYATVRNPTDESVVRIDLNTNQEDANHMTMTYPPEAMTLFFRKGKECW